MNGENLEKIYIIETKIVNQPLGGQSHGGKKG